MGVMLLAAMTCLAAYAGAQDPVRASNFRADRTTKTNEMPERNTGIFSADEYKALNRAEGTNDRIKTYVRLARVRLKNAHELLDQDDFSGADEQIQIYAALVADAGHFRAASVGQFEKANKILEQGLFEQLRALDGLRRNMTSKYSESAEQAYILATRVRLQSLSALLGAGKTLLPGSEKP